MAAQRSQPRRVASPRPTLRERVPRTQSRTADARRRRHAENPAPALHLHPAQLPQPQQALAQHQQHITTRNTTTPQTSSHAHTHLPSHRPSRTRARPEHTPAHTPLHSNHHSLPHSTPTCTRTQPHMHTHARARAFLAAAAPARASPRSRLSRLPQIEAKICSCAPQAPKLIPLHQARSAHAPERPPTTTRSSSPAPRLCRKRQPASPQPAINRSHRSCRLRLSLCMCMCCRMPMPVHDRVHEPSHAVVHAVLLVSSDGPI